MFMRITWGRLKPGHWDRYEAAWTAAVTDVTPPGLVTRYLVRDTTQPDAGFSISVWRTEADMAAHEADTATRERLLDALRPHFTGEFAVQRCEVRHVMSGG